MRTHYDLLGVPRDVDRDELKAAWKRTVRTAHPDAGGSTEEFQALQKAYETLIHPGSRAWYDLALDTLRPGAAIAQAAPAMAEEPPAEWIAYPTAPTAEAHRPRHAAPEPAGTPVAVDVLATRPRRRRLGVLLGLVALLLAAGAAAYLLLV